MSSAPDIVLIQITRDGHVLLNEVAMDDLDRLLAHLEAAALRVPLPEVHICTENGVPFRPVGNVIHRVVRAGLNDRIKFLDWQRAG
ncbi:biopolymer transporter ExbD [Pseudoduganella namucuonensis]|uniref:Biopolymer transport protein ExbD n=1 Tax=Pseudoduganella namucuonensis TaxID=1035707 RepID=A0A1I7IB77_9BURK|nr:hypothetical protein [Pseudoduganella namucuonensis]SFU70222.1 biopolymer transport protein ExbD [Pseudoduganella namucuonensis]